MIRIIIIALLFISGIMSCAASYAGDKSAKQFQNAPLLVNVSNFVFALVNFMVIGHVYQNTVNELGYLIIAVLMLFIGLVNFIIAIKQRPYFWPKSWPWIYEDLQ